MSTSNPIVLLDTNIWIDYFDPSRPRHKDALKLIEVFLEQDMTITFTAMAARDLFYVVGTTLKNDIRNQGEEVSESDALAIKKIAWSCILDMSRKAVVTPLGEPQVWLAQHYESIHNDFEDDLVLAAVETCNADYFVTNDVALLGKSSCPAFTCKDMLAFLNR